MPSHTLLRLVSILAVPLSHSVLPYNIWLTLVLAMGLGHYALSYIYARRQLALALDGPRRVAIMLFLVTLGAWLYLVDVPLVAFFLPHHVFNEVYSLKRVIGGRDVRGSMFWRSSAILFHSVLYCALLLPFEPRLMRFQHLVPPEIVLAAVAVTFVIFAYALWKLERRWLPGQWIDACSQELLGLGLIGAVYFWGVPITFMDIVAYHFAFWVFYPLRGLAKGGARPVVNYLGLSVLLTVALFLVSPHGGIFSYPMLGSVFYNQFFLWSYLHITTSFALSDAHPSWIVRLFRPRQRGLV